MRIYEHKVQYYETDQMKVVHHSNYIRWFEEARVAFMEQMGSAYQELEDQGIIVPVRSVSCEYKSMTHFGEVVEIYAYIRSFNGVRSEFTYEVRDKETGELKATGESSHCFLDEKYQLVNMKKRCPEYYKVCAGYVGRTDLYEEGKLDG